ncbi:hypothetical protein LTR17_007288 [Elasticomyces elasticus]|nr:hypothetical protein LTR17_007288 [Elasticomyces elasticus]
MPPGIQTARGMFRPPPTPSWLIELRVTAAKDKPSARGVRVDEGVRIEELQNMLALSESGCLAYTNYLRRDLFSFGRARRIAAKPWMNKAELVEVLRAADARPRFASFFKLPPELRLMIVEAAGLDYEAVLSPKSKVKRRKGPRTKRARAVAKNKKTRESKDR